MMDAVDEIARRRDPDRRRVPRALRQPVRGDPSRRRAPVAARGRARAAAASRCSPRRGSPASRTTGDGVAVFDAGGGGHRGVALVGCDGVKSAVRAQTVGDDVRVSGHVVYRAVVDAADFPADLRWNARRGLGRPELPPRPLPAARRRPVQRRRHLPQPRARDLERERRQPRRGAVVLRRHRRARAPPARTCRRAGSAGPPPTATPIERWTHGRVDPARRRRPSDAAVPGAGRVHGARGRGDARPRRCRQRRRPRRGVRALPALARRAHRARRPA